MGALGARRYWLIWAAVVPIAIWALVRSFGLEESGRLVPLLAFTPYAAVAALLVAGVATALRNWAAAAVAALATFCLALAVLPRAIGDGTVDAAGRETLTLLSANIKRGKADPTQVVALVERERPDLLMVQELTPGYVGKLDAAGLGRLLSQRVIAVFPGRRPKMPGLGIYASRPLRALGPHDNNALGAALRMPSGRSVRLVNVHPHTPKPGHIGEWRQSLEALPSAGRGAPWLLVGDFNATLDQAELRAVVDRGYRDAGDVAGMGLIPTWPEGETLPPLVTIDHVLADRRLGIVEYSVAQQPGSDHRAIGAVLALP
ncbi:MAG TPA: endonuclease/exonuclease/phosphatase family protein [Solirubrobacterales bacterium]|nr:endonuclease/exonuclease/phosphatase family protein [Solirubrobacterales bacterium]